MAELQRLRAEHAAALRRFELENRAYFGRSVSDRGDAFFARFADEHQALLDQQDAGTGAFFVLVEADGSVLGRFNLYDLDGGAARVGYRVAERASGQGVATAALAELCRRAARDHGVTTLTAEASVANAGSRRVLEKVGFTATGACVVGGHPGQRFTLNLPPRCARERAARA
jgi:[ribosomal protein S5]-alanine N-acetyltransferase